MRDGLILCAQRGPETSLPNLWEFPGGKIEPDESMESALKREILEELMCEIDVGSEITTTSYEYEFGTVTLTTFLCSIKRGEPTATEHAALNWMPPKDLLDVEWAPADIPTIELIQGN